jgi:hypothetical protein
MCTFGCRARGNRVSVIPLLGGQVEMSEFWLDVLGNLVANLITWIFLALIAGIGIIINARPKRAALFRFFGLDPINPSITAYLTTIIVQPSGAKRPDGRLSQIWEGPAISANSLHKISSVPAIFHSTFTDNLPTFVRRLLSTKNLSFDPVKIDFQPSPMSVSEIAPGPLFCLTGPGYNIATKYYLETGASYVEFLPDHQFRVKRGRLTDKIISPSDCKVIAGDGTVERFAHDLGLVSRLTDYENDRKVVIAAGTGSNGTRAAIEYVTNHWQKLDKQFQDTDFAIILECPNRRKDPQGFRLAKVINVFPSRE